MGYADRSRGGRDQVVVRQCIDVLRLIRGGAVNGHCISIEFEAAATKWRLAGLLKLFNLSLLVQLIMVRLDRNRGSRHLAVTRMSIDVHRLNLR